MRPRATRCLLPDCNRPLSFLRRLRRYEYCCPQHFIEHRRQRQAWEPAARRPESFFEKHPWGRRAFIGALGVSAVAYVSTQIPKAAFRRTPAPAPPPPPAQPSQHAASFDFSRTPDLSAWQPLEPQTAFRQQTGRGLALDGPLLYSPLPRASAGSVDLSLYLHSGSADILLAYDPSTRDHSGVRLIVEPTAVRLVAFDVRRDALSLRPNPFTLNRDGHSRHDLSVRFDSKSIVARWRDAQTYWGNLSLAPGSIGVNANATDQVLLLAARLALRV